MPSVTHPVTHPVPSSATARGAQPTLHAQVAAEQRALRWRARVADAAVGIAAAALVLALSSALLAGGRWIVWPRALPVILWGTALGAALLAVRWYMHRRPARVSLADVVADIEHEWTLRDGALRGAMELQRGDDGASARDGDALRAHAVAHVQRELLARAGASPAEQAVLAPQRRARLQRRAARMLAVAFGLVVAVVLIGRAASDGFAAMVHPIDAWRGTLLPAITFENLPTDVARGRSLRVTVTAPLRTAVRVSVERDGAPTDRRTVVLDEGRGALDLGVMTSTVRLRIDDGRSPPIDTVVRVIDRPWVGDVRIDAEYPGYLGRANETLDLSAPIRVPKGTALTVHAVAHAGAHDVRLVAVDAPDPSARAGAASQAPAVPFTSVAGYGESARLMVMRTQRYLWQAAGTGSNTTDAVVDVPEPIDITVIDDALPVVQLATDLESDLISPAMTAAFTVRADDDHGVADVALQFRRVRGAGDSATSLVRDVWGVRVPDPQRSVVQELARSFDVLALEPGDRVTVVAIARDASPWRQRGASNTLELRVPTVAEQRDLARALSDSLVQRATALSAAERALAAQTGNAARSRELNTASRSSSDAPRATGASSAAAGAANMSQASAEQMKALAQQQRQLGDRVDALRNDTEALQQRLADAGAMDAQMAEQFRELQQLLRDAMTPEMMEQLAALEKSAERLSGSEVKQSLEQLLARQQQMREQLERSAALLKRAALEGAMETLRDDAQELADAQQTAAKRLSDGEPVPPRDVQSLADRSERVADAIEQLADRLRREGATAGATRATEAKGSADAAGESMRQAAQNAASSTAPRAATNAAANAAHNAASSAERASASMQEAAEQLRAARDEQVAAWKQDLASELDQAINETAQLARQQAELANRSQQQGQPGGQQAGQSAGQQQGGQPGAQSGAQPGAHGGQQGAGDMRSAQSALQQGVQQAAARLEQAARGSSLLSQRSQRAMAEAQQKVQQATQAAAQAAAQAGGSAAGAGRAGGSEQMEGAMRDASAALNQALASLVRDRERVNTASSASGFQEMMQQLKELADQQSAVNGQMQGLSMMPGGAQGQAAQQQARMLARQQRRVAEGLQDVADVDPSGRLEALAQEAEQVAKSVARTGVADAAALARQQQLYRRMLDAGRMLEQEERDDRGERESQAGDGRGTTTRGGAQSGRAAQRFAPPAWSDLRALSAEERRAVSEYFRRLNGRDP